MSQHGLTTAPSPSSPCAPRCAWKLLYTFAGGPSQLPRHTLLIRPTPAWHPPSAPCCGRMSLRACTLGTRAAGPRPRRPCDSHRLRRGCCVGRSGWSGVCVCERVCVKGVDVSSWEGRGRWVRSLDAGIVKQFRYQPPHQEPLLPRLQHKPMRPLQNMALARMHNTHQTHSSRHMHGPTAHTKRAPHTQLWPRGAQPPLEPAD